MADAPEVPDLKKALENKPAGFAWTPGGTVAKAAASAAGVTGRAPTPRERFLALGPAKLALIAVAFLMIGGLAFSFAAFRLAGTAEGGGGAGLGGVASSMKIRFARQNDPTGYIRREKAAGNEKMRFDLIAGAADTAPGGAAGDGTGAAGGNVEGGAQMSDGAGAGSKAGTAGGAGGGAAGTGQGGGPGGSGGVAGGGAPRLTSSASSVRFQGMKRLSSTAGFRGIQGRRGTLNKSMGNSSSATPFGAGAGGNSAAGGSAASGGRGSGAAGVSAGRAAGEGASAGSAAAGGGGGGGGVPGVDMDALESTVDVPSQVQALLTDAGKLREEAEDEKKKAQILQAGSHTAQAAYHYDRYRKKKSAANDKEAEAARLTAGMENSAGSIIEPPNTAP